MTDLSDKIDNNLPKELASFMKSAGALAAKQGQNLYLVGGVVRDLLLGKSNLDLDLVVEGNAIDLAQRLAKTYKGEITTHPSFNTAKIKLDRWSVDITTARSETYERPGALPTVSPGSIDEDLYRRDFTINSMAVNLNPRSYGNLIDFHGGIDDLENKVIRILHDKSFIDDATRIWRAIRYEQRLYFQIELTTLHLLKRDIIMLDTISGDRIRYELECIFQEKYPEKVFNRAEKLGVLRELHTSLKGNGWLAEKYGQVRQLSSPEPPPIDAYLALLIYPLTDDENEQIISHLKLPKTLAQVMRDTISIKDKLQALSDPELTPSGIYSLIHGHSPLSLRVSALACDSPVARQHITLYLDKLRYVKPLLTGNNLLKMGIESGPRIKEILYRLHMAKLDGEVTSKQDEERLVTEWNKSNDFS